MNPTTNPFTALLAVGACLYLTGTRVGESQHVPARCVCLRPRNRIQGPVSDFRVVLPGPGCRNVEIIVEKDTGPVCLNPLRRQGKTLLRCWRRTKKEGRDGKTCIRQLKKQTRKRRPQMQRSKAKKTM
ncbi:uncharacterized protein LOC143476609 [Brachyhypopomus gauderio]|uniref:uncharacterized protein LOC143476609 n=1 Tax=Brachyhypopomus gauderio TaxID=698409 RepID=UPI0040417E4E